MGFKRVCETQANNCVDVLKYVSEESGMTVVIAQVPGPLVMGYFVLATEAFDDDGLPHTLEHLIFIGSEDYPYKGVLDLIANRNLASGTNAWTDTDHTCYTMKTAGTEGFLNLLPVYVHHILYPTLTDEAYTTEVHHIAGEGTDSGVVYCEMQGHESSGSARVYLEMTRAAYPGLCGYKSETGGLLKNLRESTSIKKVRDYHKEFYRPENLSLIITGQVDPCEVLSVLEKLELQIGSKGGRGAFQRPWQTPVPPLLKSVDMVVPYAADEEDNGMVYVAWRGPSAVNQIYELAACAILLRYLTDSSISPLQKEFVEVVNPLASNIGFSLQENAQSLLYMTFENVPIDKLSEVKPRLNAKLAEILTSDEPISMKRLHSVINRQKLETLLNLETQPHDAIAFMIIADFLYGQNIDHLKQRLNPINDLEKMVLEKESFWVELLKKYLTTAPSVTVRGKPSIEEKARLAQEEEIRVADQVEALGPEGLKGKAAAVAAANALNERPPPPELWTATPLPDPRRVKFHTLSPYCSDCPPLGVDLKQLPLYAHLDDVKSNFIYLMVLMDTRDVPDNLRMYLPLLMEALLKLPITRNGVEVPHEEVVAQLEEDTIATATSLGLSDVGLFSCAPFAHSACITIQVEPSKYNVGVRWLHEFLYCVKFTKERLLIDSTKMINEVAEFRRDGNKISRDIALDLNFQKGNNNVSVNNMIRQLGFLKKIAKEMDAGNLAAITDMEKLLAILTDPKNVVVRMAADLKTLSSKAADVAAPWKNFLPEGCSPCQKKLEVTSDWAFLRDALPDEKRVVVLGLGCVESSYLTLTVPGITDYNSPDIPPLSLFMQYLTQCEGPLWKQIRGLGHAYGYNMDHRPNQGLIYFTLYRSTNLLAAMAEAKSILEARLADAAEFDPLLVDSAKSSLMFEVIELEGTTAHAIKQSVSSYFKGVDVDYNRTLVGKIAEVTCDDLKRVAKKYLSSLFDPAVAKLSVTCHPNKAKELATGLNKLGFNVVMPKNFSETFLC